MGGRTAFFLILASSPLLMAAVHGIYTRVLSLRNRDFSNEKGLVFCVFLGYLPMTAALWEAHLKHLSGMDALMSWLYAFITYNVLAYCYFHLFNMTETARRLRILRELYYSGGLKEQELPGTYNADDMIRNRIERLLSLGQIKKTGGGYALDRKLFFRISAVMALWAGVLKLKFTESRRPGRD